MCSRQLRGMGVRLHLPHLAGCPAYTLLFREPQEAGRKGATQACLDLAIT